MTKNHYLNDLRKKFKICFIHNPEGFFQNSFWIDEDTDGRLILMGNSRDKRKNFKKVAILKKKTDKNSVTFWREN